MSDYLTRMAQLSRGEASAITPRLPSLFAPTAGVAMTESSPTIVQPKPKPETNIQSPLAPVEPTTDTHTPRPTTAQSNDLAKQPGNIEPLVRPASKIKAENTATPPTTPQENSNGVPSTTAPFLAKKQELPSATQNQNHTISPLTNNDLEPLVASPEVTVAFKSTKDLVGPMSNTITQANLPLVSNYKATHTAPQQSMAELPPVTEQIVKQEPTVHINIGRVEVRAHTTVPRLAPQPVRQKPQNSLSLNDYLKHGGGRP